MLRACNTDPRYDLKEYTEAVRGNYPIGRPDVILRVGRGWSLQALA
jgi:hypothetical protein